MSVLCMNSPNPVQHDRGTPGRNQGDEVVQLAAQTLQVYFTAGGALREHARYPLAGVDLRPPVLHPPGVRVFDGLDFSFGNTAAIFGPGDDVPYPEGSHALRTGPSVAAVVGAEGAIGGFTVANAWTAPDLPGVKSRDFALSIGPVLVTPDEVDVAVEPGWAERLAHAARNTVLKPGDLLVVATAAGEQVARGDEVVCEQAGIGALRNRVV
jgi:2-keto-4-pentenoate hydratase/2-oxohepta-3-ene-1,7-dioic acid hydratase in catechol pathway